MSDARLQSIKMGIPNEAGWPLKTINEICSLVSRGTAPVYVEHSDVLAIGQRCVTTSRFAPEFARPHSDRAMKNVLCAEVGDVLLNSTGTGTIGRSAVFDAPGTFIVDGHVTVLRPKTDAADGRWLNAVLRTSWAQNHLERFCYSGSTNQVELGRAPLAASALPIPRYDEQVKIVRVMDALDTAIRETEALIGKLKAVKQGLLYDLLTRGIDVNGELRPPQTEAPHLYKDSPLGWVPKEWSLGPLQNWLLNKPRNGYSPQEAPYWTGIQMLGLSCLTLEGFEPLQLKPAPARDKRLEQALLRDGDLLITRANTRELVGLVGIYRDVGTPCTYPDLMMRLTPNSEISAGFLEVVLRSSRSRRQIQAFASGTSGSMVKISGAGVSALKVAIPDADEQALILNRLSMLTEKLIAETRYMNSLKAIKSGLMDDLLTGRIRVTPLLEQAGESLLAGGK